MRQPRHVLILPSWYPSHGGDLGGIFFRDQAIALAKAGMRVGVIAPQRLSLRNVFERHSARLPSAPVCEVLARYVGVPRNRALDVMLWRRTARRLYRRYVERYGTPDIIHAHSLFPAGLLAPRLAAQGHVLTEHSSAFLGSGARSLLAPNVGTLRRFGRRIAVSVHLAARLESLAPDGGGWSYVPNLVDSSFFSPRRGRPRILRVLSVCTLTRIKAVDVLIRAFDRAFPKSQAELVIGGRGEDRRQLETLAASLASGPRIRFLGPLTRAEVREEMDSCSFFALASRHETFGVVLIEALAMGKPVLATDSGGPGSIVNSNNGILVPPDDLAALANGMAHIAARLPSYSSTVIRSDCVERFGEQAVAAQLYRHYEGVLAIGQ